MRQTVTLQLTRFTDLSESGRKQGEAAYGYRIYDEAGNNEYVNIFQDFNALTDFVNEENIFNVVRESHPSFWDMIEIERGIIFNGESIELTDDDLYDSYVEVSFDDEDEGSEKDLQQVIDDTAEGLINCIDIIIS